jgi:hypothetical protein
LTKTQELQQAIYKNYARELKLNPDAKYLHGTLLKPVVPFDTGIGGLFILGAYPSARFALIDKVSDVPVADNLGPFESERWFDGGRVRKQPSARELEDLFLGPLSVDRTKCRITDLVKIFLFKKGHIRRYSKLKAVAKPVFVITLGAEVAGILRGVRSASAQSKLLVPEVF